LVGAAGDAITALFMEPGDIFSQEKRPLYERVVMPHGLIYGHVRADESVAIDRLGNGYRYVISNRKIPAWLPHRSQNPGQRFLGWLHNTGASDGNTESRSRRQRAAANLAVEHHDALLVPNLVDEQSVKFSRGRYWAARYGDNVAISLQYHGTSGFNELTPDDVKAWLLEKGDEDLRENGELPEGWKVGWTLTGERHFLHHENKIITSNDPRVGVTSSSVMI